MLEALIELLALVFHILHFNTGIIPLIGSGTTVLPSILTIFWHVLFLLHDDLVSKKVVGVRNSPDDILEGVLTETP